MGCVFGKELNAKKCAVEREGGGGERRREVEVRVAKAEENDACNGENEKGNNNDVLEERRRREKRHRSSKPNPRLSNAPKHIHGEQVAAGWPSWLSAVAGEAINGWTPRRADTFEKLDKIGQGTYSNVYKARDTLTGKIVALKKVRFDNLEPESVKFMAREILILRRLDHPNVVKLEGLVTSRMSCSLYLVFEYMEHDLAGLAASPNIKFTEPQVKCYMHQLLSGLEHCHNRYVLHRDIKGSNLLIGNDGVLKIADFGLASFFDPNHKQPMTSRVVTLWYRPPELLLGATDYGVGVDLWSAGCILAELLAGKPIMPGRTEVEQLHKIFKLCGSPSEEYWKKSKLPHATIFKPQQSYKRCIAETFKDFPPSSLPLIETLLAIDPAERRTATAALRSEFFTTKPYACDPSSLPKYPPSKEMDAKLRDEESRRSRAVGKASADGMKKARSRDRVARAIPAPEANAELQANLDRRRLITHANAKSKSEKFPPPHQDGTLGYPLGSSHHIDPVFDPPDVPFSTTNFSYSKAHIQTWSGPLVDPAAVGAPKRKKQR
ncbi:PREDICTED: probable serine/threonine-protein kinase At1g54610 [Populus euphratica]|uniref:Probable serine/threonine-protein kinase At1g54610 n=1 Tax=Populus euphratica TaxID=75702 RepID=A0AAJ6TQ90_POPEU|nr:PREDICTED: probable serine/threonine-protein kinase At1g54610 [Populus euphratica]